MITDLIISKIPNASVVPEVTNGSYSMITSGTVEVEVGEWLYALVRMVKPKNIVETGTHFGISAAYMGVALKKNGGGVLTTMDPCTHENNRASVLFKALELDDIVSFRVMSSLDYMPDNPIDILFLDSEPHLRFQEFVRFFDHVSPGGIIMIHDLHPRLSFDPINTVSGIHHWPFGDFRETLGPYIKEHRVQVFSFPTPRGFTVFQKESTAFTATKYLKNEL